MARRSKATDCCGHHACKAHPITHVHGDDCGHVAIKHDDHIDYIVSGHLHHPHDGHCDDHGPSRGI